jgi:DNA (cytosine-5)-methyltransferase 1
MTRQAPPLRVLDLFSGIGGFSLGLERTGGFKTIAFCEIEKYARKVLEKHWPGVPIRHDVRRNKFTRVQADVICGGFPCQDISNAGKRAGLSGKRSGLYRELIRAIRVVRPKYAIVENVAALLNRGMGTVLGDLAEVGYHAEWHCIPASFVGAPHQRDRVWIIAHALADAGCARLEKRCGKDASGARTAERREPSGSDWWAVEPNVGRVADGVPARVDRLKGLGNAVVPQVVELIGQAILEYEARRRADLEAARLGNSDSGSHRENREVIECFM